MSIDDKGRAPWTIDQVDSLNERQASPAFHPYTCMAHSQLIPLLATPSGWVCPNGDCDYRQDWAHNTDLSGEWRPLHDHWYEMVGHLLYER